MRNANSEPFRSPAGFALSAALAMLLVTAVRSVAQVGPEDVAAALFNTNSSIDCSPFVQEITITAADARLVRVAERYGASDFPRDGSSFLILGSGDPFSPAQGGDLDVGGAACSGDRAQIDIRFDFPEGTVQSLAFDFDFFSYEFPEFVGSAFNDYVFAFLDGVPVSFNSSCSATSAMGGCLLTRDSAGNITNVNNAFFQACNTIGCDQPEGDPGWHTIRTMVPGDDAGRTGTLSSCSPLSCMEGMVEPGQHTLSLLVADVGDGIYTSVGLFDNLRCFSDLICSGPVTCPSDCIDDDVCNGIETCDSGGCLPGEPLDCGDSSNLCSIATCDPEAGCKLEPVVCPTGQSCDPFDGTCVVGGVPNTRTQTATNTATPTSTPTETPTFTPTDTPTQTPTATNTKSNTPTPTLSRTPTPSRTGTVTRTPSFTYTETPTPTDTRTRTPTITLSPTNTAPNTRTQTPTVTLTSTRTVSPTRVPCGGDCDGTGEVTVDEMVRGVNIALGSVSADTCSSFDTNDDGEVTINELIVGVNNALNGC